MEVIKSLMRKKVRSTSTLWRNKIQLITVRKQNVSQYKPVTLNKLNCSCLHHIISIKLTELTRSVWGNPDLGRLHRSHRVRSVLPTSVQILPHRPPARLIRPKKNKVIQLSNSLIIHHVRGSRDDAVARALASNQCYTGSIPAGCHMWAEFVLASYLTPRVLSTST